MKFLLNFQIAKKGIINLDHVMKLDGKTHLTQTGVHGPNLIVPYVKKHVQFWKGVDEVAVIFGGIFEKKLGN